MEIQLGERMSEAKGDRVSAHGLGAQEREVPRPQSGLHDSIESTDRFFFR